MQVRLECPLCGRFDGVVVHLRCDPAEYDEGYLMDPGGIQAERMDLRCGCPLRRLSSDEIHSLEAQAEEIALSRETDEPLRLPRDGLTTHRWRRAWRPE